MRGTATPLTRGPFSTTLPDTAGPLTIPADGSGSGLLDSLLPWLVNVDVFMTAIAQTNWNSISLVPGGLYTGQQNSSGAQSDSISFNVVLAAGTWTFELIHQKDVNRGIYTVSLDGSAIGTIDGYNGVNSPNQRSQITGVSVTTTGKKTLTLTMATKNALSSNYFGSLHHLQFKRTA